jgi:hypothetical protein
MEYPRFSAHLVYILKSIAAQSQDSVPPAPELMLTMALSLSSVLSSRLPNSKAPTSAFILSVSALRWASEARSAGSVMDRSPFISLRWERSFLNGPIDCFKPLSFLSALLALSLSFQKSSPDIFSSSFFISVSAFSGSKITP